MDKSFFTWREITVSQMTTGSQRDIRKVTQDSQAHGIKDQLVIKGSGSSTKLKTENQDWEEYILMS